MRPQTQRASCSFVFYLLLVMTEIVSTVQREVILRRRRFACVQLNAQHFVITSEKFHPNDRYYPWIQSFNHGAQHRPSKRKPNRRYRFGNRRVGFKTTHLGTQAWSNFLDTEKPTVSLGGKNWQFICHNGAEDSNNN